MQTWLLFVLTQQSLSSNWQNEAVFQKVHQLSTVGAMFLEVVHLKYCIGSYGFTKYRGMLGISGLYSKSS